MVYYYCRIAVLKSILENKSIWLSDMTQSNDKHEINRYLDNVADDIKKAVEELRNGGSAGDGAKTKERLFVYNQALTQLESKRRISYCLATCFTDKPDDLYQWVEYGDNGTGFSIGFDENVLKDLFNGHPFLKLAPVQYYEDVSDEIIKLKLNEYRTKLNHIEESTFPNTKERIDACARWAERILVEDAPFFKNKSFVSERETRMAYTRFLGRKTIAEPKEGSLINNIGFRTNENAVIPYLNFKLEPVNINGENDNNDVCRNVIRRIIIGPRNKTYSETIRLLLGKNGFDYDIPVELSKVPLQYR